MNTGSSLLSQASLKITKAGVRSINRIELKLWMQMKLILRFPKIKPAGEGKIKNGTAITLSLSENTDAASTHYNRAHRQ